MMRSKDFGRRAAGLILAASSATASANVDIRTVAYTGQAAPGIDGATLVVKPRASFSYFSARAEALSPTGTVALITDLAGDEFSDSYNQGLWLWDGASLAPLARTGQPLAGLAGETLDRFSSSIPTIDTASRVGFAADTERAGVTGSAFFEAVRSPGGSPVAFSTILRDGDSLSDDPRQISYFALIGSPTLNVSPGGIYALRVFRVDADPPVNPDGTVTVESLVVVGRPGALAVSARSEFAPPGLPAGPVSVSSAGLTRDGRPVLSITTTSNPYTPEAATNCFIYTPATSPGEFRRVAGTGDPATVTGGTFSQGFNAIVATASPGPAVAITAYATHTHDDDSDPTYDEGVWVNRGDGNLTLAARWDDPAPGTTETFQYVEAAAVSSAGDVAIVGDLGADSRTHGLWLWHDGALVNLVLTQDDDATGQQRITGVHLNDAGQIAFGIAGQITRPYSPLPFNTLLSIYAGSVNNPEPIVSLGDTLTVDGISHTITALDLSDYGNRPGAPQALNDAGQLLFAAQLDGEGWGVFLATVPEPGTGPLLIFAATVVVHRHRLRP